MTTQTLTSATELKTLVEELLAPISLSAKKCWDCSHRPSCGGLGRNGFRCCYTCKHLNHLKQCTVAANKREINTPGKNVVCLSWKMES